MFHVRLPFLPQHPAAGTFYNSLVHSFIIQIQSSNKALLTRSLSVIYSSKHTLGSRTVDSTTSRGTKENRKKRDANKNCLLFFAQQLCFCLSVDRTDVDLNIRPGLWLTAFRRSADESNALNIVFVSRFVRCCVTRLDGPMRAIRSNIRK